MFKAEIRSETLKGLVYIISMVVDEVKMSIHPDSIGLKAMDPAHVAMLDVSVSSKAFVSFSADEGEIGLDLEKVKSVLKLAGPNDTIVLDHDPDQGRLTMKIGNITRRMSLVDTSNMSDPHVPKIDFKTEVDLSVDQLQKGIRASDTISDHIAFEVSQEGFTLSCDGDTDYVSLKIPASELNGLTAEEKVRSMYPLNYLSNITKVIPAGTVVKMKLGSDYPVMMEFSLADGEAQVVYLLAPRIENE